jgi:hypothetical protein
MNQRVLHLRVDLLLRLLLCVLPWLMLGAPLTASAARGDPVAIDSPSWQALMARPAAQDGTTAFYAADLLATWGRRDEADSLRRALLVRHLRTLAGDSVPEATLGQVWATAPATLAEVAAAHERARVRASGAGWAKVRPVDDAAARHLAEWLGNRPPLDLAAFVRRWGDCVPQGTCAAPPSRQASRPVKTDAEREKATREHERQQRARQRRGERMQTAALVAYALGTLALHLLLARFAGRWFAFGVSLLIGAGLGWWLIAASGPLSGWGGLAVIILALGLAGSGLLLAPLYDALYTRFFKRS